MAMGPLKRIQRLGFIGGGNMAEAFIRALIRAKIAVPSSIFVSDVDPARLKALRNAYSGLATTRDNRQVFLACDAVIFSVKPQDLPWILSELSETGPSRSLRKKLVVSIAAGFPLRKIEAVLYPPLSEAGRKRLPIIRVMPNTPAQVLSGISGMSPNRYATRQDVRTTRKILSAMGWVLEFKEKDLDAVTALSGSGPAYVFYFIEVLTEAGVCAGLDKDAATTLTIQTFRGALDLLQERRESPAKLRREVTSPGGTTEAAFRVMDKGRVGPLLIEAVLAATRRSRELGR